MRVDYYTSNGKGQATFIRTETIPDPPAPEQTDTEKRLAALEAKVGIPTKVVSS